MVLFRGIAILLWNYDKLYDTVSVVHSESLLFDIIWKAKKVKFLHMWE